MLKCVRDPRNSDFPLIVDELVGGSYFAGSLAGPLLGSWAGLPWA